MKTLKFTPELAELIRLGHKTSTWRLFDDKDLSEGDALELYVKGSEKPFARAIIYHVHEKLLGSITTEELEGHEKYASHDEMIAAYRGYYGPEVNGGTVVKIIKFQLRSVMDDNGVWQTLDKTKLDTSR